MNAVLLYGGIGLAACALAAGAVAGLLLRRARKRLEQKFDREFGPRRH